MSAMASRYENLVSLFQHLGARHPEGWARSEVNEGIPQLMRFLFLRGMWKGVVREDDPAWIDAHVAASPRDPNGPLRGVGAALRRLLAAGADRRDLCELVRGMQYETLFQIAYLLDDPTPAWDDVRGEVPQLEDVAWGLWAENSKGHPIRRVDGLHERALDTDPTGREMRPPAKGTESL
jgi:hypothetical protein